MRRILYEADFGAKSARFESERERDGSNGTRLMEICAYFAYGLMVRLLLLLLLPARQDNELMDQKSI